MPESRTSQARALDIFRRQNLAWLLVRLLRDFQARCQAAFGDRDHEGMQMAHAAVLVYLPLEGGRLTDLAAAAGVTKQSMGALVDDMERFGYVERVPHAGDRRAKRICFTEAGIALLEDSREIVSAIWDRYAEILGERRLAALRNSLADLLAGIEPAGRASGHDAP